VVIGGSDFYSGSPALAALAGFRAGVDMVRIIAPKRAADIIASFSPILAMAPNNCRAEKPILYLGFRR
jgi:NAD(P)H-hydrate epimerase